MKQKHPSMVTTSSFPINLSQTIEEAPLYIPLLSPPPNNKKKRCVVDIQSTVHDHRHSGYMSGGRDMIRLYFSFSFSSSNQAIKSGDIYHYPPPNTSASWCHTGDHVMMILGTRARRLNVSMFHSIHLQRLESSIPLNKLFKNMKTAATRLFKRY